MTRILYLLLAVLGLSACGNGSSPTDSAPPSQSVISEQEISQSQDNSSSQEEPMLKITVGD